MRRYLYIDCDGVLADFNEGFRRVFNREPNRNNPSMTSEEMWAILEKESAFFESLPILPGASLLMSLFSYHRPIILTAVPPYDWAVCQKLRWRDKHFPGTPMITCAKENKPDYCKPGDLLIDDLLKAKYSWEEKGGSFIHYSGVYEAEVQAEKLGWLTNL